MLRCISNRTTLEVIWIICRDQYHMSDMQEQEQDHAAEVTTILHLEQCETPDAFRFSGSLFDLSLAHNGLSSSWAELRQHVTGLIQKKDIREPAQLIQPTTDQDIEPNSDRLDVRSPLASVNAILQKAPRKLLKRANKDGSWNASYLGGATHTSLRSISLCYLDAEESPIETKLVIKDLLSLQKECGGYGIYPVGPSSKAVSRLAYLALVCAMNSNQRVLLSDRTLRLDVERSLKRTRRFIEYSSSTKEWLLYSLLADFCWKLLAPKTPNALLQLPFFSNSIFLLQKLGGLGWFQSVLHEILPAILILFQPELNSNTIRPSGLWHRIKSFHWFRHWYANADIRFAEKLERQIIDSQDGDGAWVETIVATSLNVMALKKRGYANDHKVIANAITYLKKAAVFDGDRSVHINWATGDMWDTAIHADLLHFINATPPEKIVNQVFPHMMTGFRSDGRWSFSILGRITDNDSSSMTLATFAHLYPAMNTFQQRNAKTIIERVCASMLIHQQNDGGWATFDERGVHRMGYKTPTPEKGAFFDFSSPDVTGRVIFGLLAACASGALPQSSIAKVNEAIKKAHTYFSIVQSKQGFAEGSYWSRWLLGPIAGTCFVAVALRSSNVLPEDPMLKRARAFILRTQHADTGGWGETRQADCRAEDAGRGPSTPLQTALAIMTLIACGEDDGDAMADDAIERGIRFLLRNQVDGHWEDKWPLGTILTGLDYFITPENSEVAILAALTLYRRYKAAGSRSAIFLWVKRHECVSSKE